jgi:hypothetical protein
VIARRVILFAAGALLAACTPDSAEPEAAVSEPSVRAYFEQTFSGLFVPGASRMCSNCTSTSGEVLNLTRDGDMIAARTRCQAEGQTMADNTHMLTPVSEDTISVSDGHYEWIRHACGAAHAPTQGGSLYD